MGLWEWMPILLRRCGGVSERAMHCATGGALSSDDLVGVLGSQGREALVTNRRSPDLSTSHPLPQHMVPAWGVAVRFPLLWGHVLPRTLAILAGGGLAACRAG